MRILVFGDSIAYGAWDTAGGWVERLKQDAHQRTVASGNVFKRQVINLGVGGHSSTEILARLENEINARHSNSWPFVFIFSYGTNDERTLDGEIQTSVQQFIENTNNIIATAQKYSDKILFVGLPPLPSAEIAFKRHVYSDERLKEYDRILQATVESAGVTFVPIRQVFLGVGMEELFGIHDDPHPNDKGHQLIYETVRPALDKLLEQ